MKRHLPYILGALGVVLTASVFVYQHAKDLTLDVIQPAGPIGAGELDIIILVTLFSSLVIIPVFFLLFYFAWRYRASKQENVVHEQNWDHDSPIVEFSWWLVPGIIITILAVVAWRTSHSLDPYQPLPGRALTVQVVALNWKWLFLYPDQGVASVNELVIPYGVPVHFVMTADAPMNSFWIPQLGGQIMVMPGMTTQLYLKADREGIYKGYSANISGKGFAGMAFDTHAVSEQEFDTWVQSGLSAMPLTAASYNELAHPSEYDSPKQYALIDSSLYDRVVETVMQGKRVEDHPDEAAMPMMHNHDSMGGMNM